MLIWVIIWGLVIVAAVIVDASIPYGQGKGNRNGSKHLGKGR